MTDEKENGYVQKRFGKWSQEGIPHSEWECVEIEDLGSPSKICEMCEAQEIRYVHYMKHPSYPDTLAVGCVCSGNMGNDFKAARSRDTKMQKRAGKKNRWLTRKWKLSAKGNEYIIADGYVITVFKKAGTELWRASVTPRDAPKEENLTKFINRNFPTPGQAKLAAFDLVTELLNE